MRDDVEILKKLLTPKESTFKVEEACFDKQIEFIQDPHRFKTACCGGRAGKTVADAAYLIHAARSKPRGVALYLTLSRNNAKKLVWPEILKINQDHKIGGIPNESDLSLKMPNGSFIYASGASNVTEIEKFRGLPLILCIIDEVQSFKSYVQSLIDDVISKRLFDFNGTLALTGTPGPVPSGYFYEACNSDSYRHFHWTMFDNPWIKIKSGKDPQKLLEEEMQRKGVEINDPSIQREVFGQWVLDSNALVFRYSSDTNDFSGLPETDGKWHHIFGIDLGFDDADAIAVIAYNDKLKAAYLVEEFVETKLTISQLAFKIKDLYDKYNPDKIVADTGGLGKKIVEELQTRFELPIVAAEKARKFEFIELLNDAMRRGEFMAKKDGPFAHDAMLVEWDQDADPTTERFRISDKYHSDITDAVLYGFREAFHWLFEPEPEKIELNSPKWFDKEAKDIEDALERQLESKKQTELWGIDWS